MSNPIHPFGMALHVSIFALYPLQLMTFQHYIFFAFKNVNTIPPSNLSTFDNIDPITDIFDDTFEPTTVHLQHFVNNPFLFVIITQQLMVIKMM